MATLKENIEAIKLEKETKILPQNIRSGITAFGVKGTLEMGGEVKLFPNVDAMNLTEPKTNSDMAIVYGAERGPFTSTSNADTFYFPDTVVLDEAIKTTSSCYLIDLNDSSSTRHYINLTATAMTFRNQYTYSIIVKYTSTDGITYTRNVGYDETYTYDKTLKLMSGYVWNDAYGKFLQCVGGSFKGLYGTKSVVNKDILTIDETEYVFPKGFGDYSGEISANNTSYKISTDFSKSNNNVSVAMKINNYNTDNDMRYVTSCSVYFIAEGYVLTGIISNTNEKHITVWAYETISSNKQSYMKKVDFDEYGNVTVTDYNLDELITVFPILGGETTSTGRRYHLSLGLDDGSIFKIVRGSVNGDTITIPSIGSTEYTVSYANGNATITYNANKPAWTPANTQFTLKNSNQLLPGVVALGTDNEYVGDGSIYDNLDWETLLDKKFNLTKTAENALVTLADYYSTMPTKYISSVTDKKQTFLKRNSTRNSTTNHIGIVQNVDIKTVPLQENCKLYHAVYHQPSNTLSSIQQNSTQYIFYIQNYTTKEILYSENINKNSYLYLAGNNVVRYEYTSGSTSTSGTIYIYRYNLSTYAKTSILSFTTSNQTTDFELVNVDDRFIIFAYAYASSYSSSSTCYRYVKVFDGETNTTTNIVNGTSITSTTSSPTIYLNICNCDDELYILSGVYRSSKYGYNLNSYNKSTKALSSLTSSSSSVSSISNTDKNGYADSSYIYFSNRAVPKSSLSTLYYTKIKWYDAQGNEIDKYKVDSNSYMYSVNGDVYAYSSTNKILAKVQSYTVGDGDASNVKYVHCRCSKFYPMYSSQAYREYTSNGTSVIGTTCYLDLDTLQDIDDDMYSAAFKSQYAETGRYPTTMEIVLYSCDESTSLDYDFSVTYGGSDVFVQINPDYLCVSKEQYNTAIDTVNEILGEEV